MYTSLINGIQEQNEQSGSRGEANFVWRCKNCKVRSYFIVKIGRTTTLTIKQREHSANIIEAPKVYPLQDPPKSMNIITMDCRGLEFVDFKADVSNPHP